MNNVHKVSINLPYIQENIFIGLDLLNLIVTKIKESKYHRLILVVDKNFNNKWNNYINILADNLEIDKIIFLKPAVNFKSFKVYEEIIGKLIKYKYSRNSCLISVGGGYISDVVGFVASSYMRGIDFVQISTTFMSMVDPVIGKVAINYKDHKNILGSFYSPKYVFCDQQFIKTLSKREIIMGLSEVWKHALLKNNKGIIGKIEKVLDGDRGCINELILFSIETKKMYVEPDYDDQKGKHKALSLGHTFANYLEKQPDIRHGSAVVYGIIFEAILSNLLNKLTDKNYNSILETARLFERELNGLKKIQKKINTSKAIASFRFDKISGNNGFNFVIPTNEGHLLCNGLKKDVVVNTLKKFKDISL